MKFDYLIVGSGLSGVMLCEALRKRGKTFKVISNKSQQASIVASGLYNPVVLKRFNKAWDAEKHLPVAMSAYEELELFLGIKIDYKLPIYRLFSSIAEQNNWIIASDKIPLKPYLISNIKINTNQNIYAPYGYGEVKNTGRIDTKLLLESYSNVLNNEKLISHESFEYDKLKISKKIVYKGIESENIIFSEGFGVRQNPFFNYLPIEGTKGELIIINAPKLNSEVIIKSSVFIIPIGKNNYLVGSTYAWDDFNNDPTINAKNKLLNKLDKLVLCPYKVVYQRAGIRPTVIDRRPLVGQHKSHENLYILNGLGSRGVLIAPTVANDLINFIEDKLPLQKEINISRFD
ncbi:MAG: NAD(P)/FAD-dependent oxidoreductase [Flavobacteriaceae bacterium]